MGVGSAVYHLELSKEMKDKVAGVHVGSVDPPSADHETACIRVSK